MIGICYDHYHQLEAGVLKTSTYYRYMVYMNTSVLSYDYSM